MVKQLIPPRDGDVEDIALREALEERYLQYALSTITGRALPDARDGLKPVHRRLLYAMQVLRLDPGAAFKKCDRCERPVVDLVHWLRAYATAVEHVAQMVKIIKPPLFPSS